MSKIKDLSQLNPRPGGSTWHIVKFKGDQDQILVMIDPLNLNIAIVATGAKTGDWVGVSSLLYFKSISDEESKKILEREIKNIKSALPELIGLEKGSVGEVLKKMEKIYQDNFSKK